MGPGEKNSTWMTFVYFLTSETLLRVLKHLLSSFKEQFHQCFPITYFLQEKYMLWVSLRYLGAGTAHCCSPRLPLGLFQHLPLRSTSRRSHGTGIFCEGKQACIPHTEKLPSAHRSGSEQLQHWEGRCPPPQRLPPEEGHSHRHLRTSPHRHLACSHAARAACGSVTSRLSPKCPRPRWMHCPQ